MGPQWRLGIYVGFDSPSIIRYLESLTGDVFRARFPNCHSYETVFPPLGGEKSIPEERKEITWKASILSHFDPRKNQCELEVQMIIYLQNLANQLPDAFVDVKKVTKSHIPAVNAPARIEDPGGHKANESKTRLKRGRPIGSKDVAPWKRRTKAKQNAPADEHGEQRATIEAHIEQQTLEEVQNEQISLEEAKALENCEISISYVHKIEKWDRNNFAMDNIFAFQVALDIIQNDDDDLEPQNVDECKQRNDCPKWKEAVRAELH